MRNCLPPARFVRGNSQRWAACPLGGSTPVRSPRRAVCGCGPGRIPCGARIS